MNSLKDLEGDYIAEDLPGRGVEMSKAREGNIANESQQKPEKNLEKQDRCLKCLC